MKNSLVVAACTGMLVASLVACGGSDDKSGLPTFPPGSSPSASAPSQPMATTSPATGTSQPTATSPATGTKSGPAPLAAKSTYTYDGLKLTVNLPSEIPARSRPSLRLFSEFLQADGRTTAKNKLDPALAGLASSNVVKNAKAVTGGESVQGIGAVSYTVSKIQTGSSGLTLINGCLDQGKLVQVRRDGSHFVDAATKANPTLKLTATISPGTAVPRVTSFTFSAGSCS